MDVAHRCSDDTGPSLALHSELVQSLWESSGKRKLLSHPKGPSDRRDGILCTAVKAVLCKHYSLCSSIFVKKLAITLRVRLLCSG